MRSTTVSRVVRPRRVHWLDWAVGTATLAGVLACAAGSTNPNAIVATPAPAPPTDAPVPASPPSGPKAAPTPGPTPAAASTAIDLPTFDIYLASIDPSTSPPTIGVPTNLTARDGYDNQPHFADALGKLLYTSIRDEQADIYTYDFTSRSTAPLRHDPANEYSPTVMPDGRGVSMIREREGVQMLWHYSLTGEDLGAVLPTVVDIGYHAWLSPTDVALFVLDTEHGRHRLEIVHVPNEQRRVVAENIGRCLTPASRTAPAMGSILFVQKRDAQAAAPASPSPLVHDIVRFDLTTGSTVVVAPTRPGREDFAVAPDGTLYMADGTALYRFSAGSGWALLTDLARPGIAEVTRLAVAADGRSLAFVASPVVADKS